MPRSALTIDGLTKQASGHLRVAEAGLRFSNKNGCWQSSSTGEPTVEALRIKPSAARCGTGAARGRRRLSVLRPQALRTRIRAREQARSCPSESVAAGLDNERRGSFRVVRKTGVYRVKDAGAPDASTAASSSLADSRERRRTRRFCSTSPRNVHRFVHCVNLRAGGFEQSAISSAIRAHPRRPDERQRENALPMTLAPRIRASLSSATITGHWSTRYDSTILLQFGPLRRPHGAPSTVAHQARGCPRDYGVQLAVCAKWAFDHPTSPPDEHAPKACTVKAANEGAATIAHHRSRAGRPHGQPPRCPSSKEEDGRQRNLAEDGITSRQRSMAGTV
jgi:hypothetical protein